MDEFDEEPSDEVEDLRWIELFRIDMYIILLKAASKIIKKSKEPLTLREAIQKQFSTDKKKIEGIRKD